MKSYNDAYFDVLAAQGDPDYKKFYDRVNNNRKEAVYDTFIEGTRRIMEERAVLHAPDLMLFYHFVDNPQVLFSSLYNNPILFVYSIKLGFSPKVPRMQIFAKGRGEAKGAIVTKNSPLGPIMSFTILQLMEQGAVDRALSKFKVSIKITQLTY